MGEGFVMIPCAVLDMKITFLDIAVYAALSKHWSSKNGCYPSLDVLCEVSRLSRKTVVRSLKRLEAVGAITRDKKHRTVTHYQLPFNLECTRYTQNWPEVHSNDSLSVPGTLKTGPKYTQTSVPGTLQLNHLTKTNELNIVHAQYARAHEVYKKLYGTSRIPPKQLADITENQDAFGEEIVIEAIEYGHENEKPWGWIVGRMRGRGKQREETNARVNEYAEYDRYD